MNQTGQIMKTVWLLFITLNEKPGETSRLFQFIPEDLNVYMKKITKNEVGKGRL